MSRQQGRASRLLASAASHHDDPRSRLPGAARGAALRGFRGGAEWMRTALAELRGDAPAPVALDWDRVGLAKYGVALLGGGLAAGPGLLLPGGLGLPLALLGFVLGFYAIESRRVFLFPLLLDGTPEPEREGGRLIRAAGGRVAVGCTTMRIAAAMLFGGLRGGGFLRSWCVGCLAVVHWYEELRRR